jgi:hypothetical protein
MTMDISMHVGSYRCVGLRVCVSVCMCWMVPAGRAAHYSAGAGEPAPRGGLAQTVMSLAPGAAWHAAHQAAWAY